MAKDSGIQWTVHTFNPWWGCEKVSEACKHCYAESFAKRVGEKVWGGDESPRRFFGDKHWNEPLKWNKAAEKAGEHHPVFCASMADVFEDRRDLDAARARLWALIAATPWLDWQLLSKRWGTADVQSMVPRAWDRGWPANVWAGATVENQERAEERIPALLRVPARVRFLSMEPLLGPVDLDPPTCPDCDGHDYIVHEGTVFCHECTGDDGVEMAFSAWLDPCADEDQRGINWVIVGGESGGKPRPFDLMLARDIVRQCRDASVPVFVKQFGALPVVSYREDESSGVEGIPLRGGTPDGGLVLRLVDSHGGDMAEWPADLRVREMPVCQ